MVASCKSQAFWGSTCLTRRRFKVFVDMVEKLHLVSLPFPDSFPSRSSFKEFCSALLERRKHLWDVALQPLGADSRRSVGMSLFLFRKIIPSDRPDALALLEKVAKPSPPPDRRFLEFVEHEVNRLMPVGWDRDYVQKGIASVVPTKGYSELNGIDGCSRDWFIRNLSYGDFSARQNFVQEVLTSTQSHLKSDDTSRLVVVPSSGKYRALSIPPVKMNYLRPLHKCMYDYMSRYKWLLRGDAKVTSFRDFKIKEGEVFCSGDYESATDNLNSEVQKEILRCVLQNARNVPHGLIVQAMQSMSLWLSVSDRDGNLIARKRQLSGQMMGNLLSFPLLCLVNYITFRWLTMDDSIPVRINGDDIVFRARPEVVERWKAGVSASGLTLSEGKTMVDSRYFSLNSTLFKGSRKRVRLVPMIRSKALFGLGDEDSIASLRGRFHSFVVGYGSSKRLKARIIFLRENSGWIRKSCRSLTQGLGIQVEPEALLGAGMWERELRYLDTVEKPLPNLPGDWAHMPDGYHLRWVDKDTKRTRQKDKLLLAEFIESAWKPRAEGVSWKTREEVYCRGLDLSNAVILRSKGWTTRMVRLGQGLLEKIYGELRSPYRWIKTRWSAVDRHLFKKRPKLYPCWFSDNEPSTFRLVPASVEDELPFWDDSVMSSTLCIVPLALTKASPDPPVLEDLVENAQETNRDYRNVAPPLEFSDPGYFTFEEAAERYCQ